MEHAHPASRGGWTTLARRTVYDGQPWLSVHLERVRTASGRTIEDFHQAEARDFAIVFALDADGRVLLVRQWRHGPRRTVLAFPGGHVDDGESAQDAAGRECLEETGHACGELRSLGRHCMHPNLGLGWGSFFFCPRARLSGQASGDDRADIELARLTPAEVEAALHDGRICTVHDALCASLGLAALAGTGR
jgi:ADP-ribose pyrophosphatase